MDQTELGTIKLSQAVIKSIKMDTKMILSTLTCTSSFDQITAEAVKIKDSIYNEDGLRRGVLKSWGIGQEHFGRTITFQPHQKAIFGNKPFSISSVRLKLDKVIEQDADGKLKMSFQVTIAGLPIQLMKFLQVVKRGECAVTITKPSKSEEENAKRDAINFGLFSIPKEKTTKAAKEDKPEKPEKNKSAAEAKPEVAPEKPANGVPEPALASAREMGEKTRGRHRTQ